MTEEKGTKRNKMDYKNGNIYKILNHVTDEVYVGSTVRSLSKRMHAHKEVSQSNTTRYAIHNHMREIGCESFYIELIEPYPCSNKEELRAKEGEWIRKFGTLNKENEGRTMKQHYDDHNPALKDKAKAYRQNNNQLMKKRAKCGGNKTEKRY